MAERMNPPGIDRDEMHGRRNAALTVSILLLALCSVCLVAPRPVLCGGDIWAFIWVDSGRNDYEVRKGSAVVTIKEGKVEATMRSQQGVEYKLSGIISKGQVKAKFTIVGSEFADAPFSGSHVVRSWASDVVDDSIGRESIVLTNGMSVLALTREIVK